MWTLVGFIYDIAERLFKSKTTPTASIERAFCPRCGSADTEQYGSDPDALIRCFRCESYSYPSVLGPGPCGHDARLQSRMGDGSCLVRCSQCGRWYRLNAPSKVRNWSPRRSSGSDVGWRN
jgi:hypothetical protein